MLTLAITRFEADPTMVSQILDLEPTSIWRKGEVDESGGPRKVNAWWVEARRGRLRQGLEHERALAALIERIGDRQSHFAQLRAQIRPEILTISGEMYVPEMGECGVWLSADQMSVLAGCGVAWGLDLFSRD